MMYLIGAAILATSFFTAAAAQAQTRPVAPPDQVTALGSPVWSKSYPAVLARQRAPGATPGAST